MFAFIKNVFLDIVYLYKNFLHWNISKVLIFLWAIVLWLLAMLPFVIVIFIYGSFTDIEFMDLSFQIISNSTWSDWVVNILLYFTKIFFVIAYLYGYVLLVHLNLSYLKKKNIPYFSNYYFDVSRIKKYISISFFHFLAFLIPLLLFLVLILILVLIVWVDDSKSFIIESSMTWNSNIFTLLSFWTFIISALLFLYILYRICFSYFIFIEDTKNSKKAIEYIKKSISLTKWCKSLLRFIVVLLIILPFAIGFKFTWGYLEHETSTLNNYLAVKDITLEEEEYLKTTPQYAYYQSLVIKYSDLSESELKSKSTKNDISFFLFNIFSFIFIYWVFIMILSSFYKRELLK
jgi:hypothetical protein